MELPTGHVTDWLCASRVQTDLSQQELSFRARQGHFTPDILMARHGSMGPHGKGAVFIMFELIQLDYEEAAEDAGVIIDATLTASHLEAHSKPYTVDIRPLKDPRPDLNFANNVIPLKWYRKSP